MVLARVLDANANDQSILHRLRQAFSRPCLRSSNLRLVACTHASSPSSDLALSHVAIGRGTQNYTCDLSNDTAVPVAAGAVASLFNVSCLAAANSPLLSILPVIALNLPVPTSDDVDAAANTDLSGHHYFLDATTPFFNMDTAEHSYGMGAFKKASSSAAPSDAMKGQYGQGYGAVAWLKLAAKDTTGQVFQEVYRLNTAGGSPPSSCSGMPSKFEVEYAAQYWLYE
ncbi:hypothetical protein LTR66_007483 [Elasticomyces elasticus]|nr:hypothetical protein LTR66_007483 [Elasticomyces elasticus]